MNTKLIVKHGDVTIEVNGTKAEAIVSQYKDLLWELGYPVQGGKPFAPEFVPAFISNKAISKLSE